MLDLCTSSLLHLRETSPAIADVIQQDLIGEPYVAPDMLLALCHHASTHDLSESAISELLVLPNLAGFPCLDVTNTSSILSAYYESLQGGKTQ